MRTISNCNCVVVGGAGFLGSHLVNHLIDDRDCRVLVVDNLCVGRREFVHPKAEFHHADITHSEGHLRNVFEQFRRASPSEKYPHLYVFNYAAWPYIPDSFQRPLHVFEVNATGAIKVINAAQAAGADGILQVSSAEIYGHNIHHGKVKEIVDEEPRKIVETDLVVPHSTYGTAKAAVDYYCQSAWKERQTKVIALRQFNCVGERETHPYIVPEIIGQLSRWQKMEEETRGRPRSTQYAEPPPIRLGNNSFRDFLYAGDAVRIAVELLERGQFGEVYNLGSETGIKMYDLAKLIGKLMGFADVKVELDPARVRPWEIWHLQSDNTKIKSILPTRGRLKDGGFMPGRPGYLNNLTPLEEALKRAVKWYQENSSKWPWEK